MDTPLQHTTQSVTTLLLLSRVLGIPVRYVYSSIVVLCEDFVLVCISLNGDIPTGIHCEDSVLVCIFLNYDISTRILCEDSVQEPIILSYSLRTDGLTDKQTERLTD